MSSSVASPAKSHGVYVTTYTFPSKTSPLRAGASVEHVPNINKLYYIYILSMYHYEIRLQVRENTFGPGFTRTGSCPSTTEARVEKPSSPAG